MKKPIISLISGLLLIALSATTHANQSCLDYYKSELEKTSKITSKGSPLTPTSWIMSQGMASLLISAGGPLPMVYAAALAPYIAHGGYAYNVKKEDRLNFLINLFDEEQENYAFTNYLFYNRLKSQVQISFENYRLLMAGLKDSVCTKFDYISKRKVGKIKVERKVEVPIPTTEDLEEYFLSMGFAKTTAEERKCGLPKIKTQEQSEEFNKRRIRAAKLLAFAQIKRLREINSKDLDRMQAIAKEIEAIDSKLNPFQVSVDLKPYINEIEDSLVSYISEHEGSDKIEGVKIAMKFARLDLNKEVRGDFSDENIFSVKTWYPKLCEK